MADKKWVEQQRKDREETKRRAQEALDNPIIYTHTVNVVDEYYCQKIVLGLMIWGFIAFLGASPIGQAAFVVIYIWKML